MLRNTQQGHGQASSLASYPWEGIPCSRRGYGLEAGFRYILNTLRLSFTYRPLGLGLYLEEIDPYHQPWRNQLRNVFILCRVHFARGADLAARGDTALREVMQHLLTVTTLNGWNACIQALQGISKAI